MKTCTKCKIEKELTSFGKTKQNKSGFNPSCKECASIANKAYIEKNPEKRKETCRKYHARNAEKLSAKSSDWYRENKEKASETRKNWRLRNKEKDNADIAKYQKTHTEKLSIAAKIWQKNNKNKCAEYASKYRAINPEKSAAARRLWASQNKHKINEKKRRRYAYKMQATPTWANKEKMQDFYFAANFLGMATGEFHHVDHIVPLKSKYVCGLHCEANLRVLPALENLKKSNRYWPDMP